MAFNPTQDPETGRRTSQELTEARTVLSRAESALERLQWVREYDQVRDPMHAQIEDALIRVRNLLEPYRRTGRPRKAQEWTSE